MGCHVIFSIAGSAQVGALPPAKVELGAGVRTFAFGEGWGGNGSEAISLSQILWFPLSPQHLMVILHFSLVVHGSRAAIALCLGLVAPSVYLTQGLTSYVVIPFPTQVLGTGTSYPF